MDLGRELCRPRPRCERCPLGTTCAFRAGGSRGSGRRARRPAQPYDGSTRQARGAVVRVLREDGPKTFGELAERTGLLADRVLEAVRSLHADGMVVATQNALRGLGGGRLDLPR